MIQNKCKIIGITGGIASGKTTVKTILTDRAYIVIDSDIIARDVFGTLHLIKIKLVL